MKEDKNTTQLDAEGMHFVLVICRYDRGLQDFIIVYFVEEGGKRKEIVRYDCAHGFAHRDLPSLSEKDKRRKKRMPDLPLKQQFIMARDDVLSNWKKYWMESEGRAK
ncbi:MAG: hypothetical protein V1708_06420 [Candidatus Micrarchaeota archaeon]